MLGGGGWARGAPVRPVPPRWLRVPETGGARPARGDGGGRGAPSGRVSRRCAGSGRGGRPGLQGELRGAGRGCADSGVRTPSRPRGRVAVRQGARSVPPPRARLPPSCIRRGVAVPLRQGLRRPGLRGACCELVGSRPQGGSRGPSREHRARRAVAASRDKTRAVDTGGGQRAGRGARVGRGLTLLPGAGGSVCRRLQAARRRGQRGAARAVLPAAAVRDFGVRAASGLRPRGGPCGSRRCVCAVRGGLSAVGARPHAHPARTGPARTRPREAPVKPRAPLGAEGETRAGLAQAGGWGKARPARPAGLGPAASPYPALAAVARSRAAGRPGGRRSGLCRPAGRPREEGRA